MQSNLETRLKALERDARPTEQAIIDYLVRTTPLPGDRVLEAWLAANTPDYIRRMTNDELIAFVTGAGGVNEY